MEASSTPSQPLAQQAPLPVVLSLEPPAAAAPDLPLLSIPCTRPIGKPDGPLSWLELLGER